MHVYSVRKSDICSNRGCKIDHTAGDDLMRACSQSITVMFAMQEERSE